MAVIVLMVVLVPCLGADPPTTGIRLSPSGTQTISAGENASIECQVKGGNPLATLSWRCKGLPAHGYNISGPTLAASRLIVPIDKSYHDQRCVCNARHPTSPDGVFATKAVRFDVIYEPSQPIWITQHPNNPVKTGSEVQLVCNVEGGNPLAIISWTCSGSPRTGSNISRDDRAASRLRLTMNQSYHHQQCVCTASHPASPDGVFGTKAVRFDVIYPPTETVYMTPSGNQTFLTRSNVTLTCQVRGGKPLARFTWHCKRKTLNGRRWSAGNISWSSLSITVDTSYHRETCTCTALHDASRNRHFGEANVMFDILYSPVITLDPTVVHVQEGSNFTKMCSARGNPTPTISWHHGSHVTSGDVLPFTNISRLDTGNYTCNASATRQGIVLSSVATIQLVVLYGPDVDVYINNTTEDTKNITMKCTAKGVPATFTYTWTHSIGSTLIRDTFAHVTDSGSVSTLIISRARLQDMGTYKCEVENGVPGRDGQTVQTAQGFLFVIGSPRMIGAKKKYFTKKNASLAINMTFLSFPEADTTTVHHTGPSSPPSSRPTVSVAPVLVEVAFYNKTVTIDGFVVQILFNKFETGHRGQYRLFINNSYDYNYDFGIEISDKPDTPTHLVIDGITENSARISWLPGEDNGHPQTFTISYRSEEQQQNVSLNHTVTEFTVTKLSESTKYDVILYASNEKGASEKIDTTFHTKSDTPVRLLVIIAGGSGAAVVIIIVVVCIQKTRKYSPRPKSTEPKDRPGDNNDGMKDNILYESAGPNWAPEPAEQADHLTPTKADGMKDNILYETTGPTWVPQPDPSTQTSSEGAAYAEVQKPKKARTEHEINRPTDDDNDGMKANVLYESAGSNGSQQPGPSTQGTESETAAYAEVQ